MSRRELSVLMIVSGSYNWAGSLESIKRLLTLVLLTRVLSIGFHTSNCQMLSRVSRYLHRCLWQLEEIADVNSPTIYATYVGYPLRLAQ